MVKKYSPKKVIKFILSLALAVAISVSFGMGAGAETYYKIKFDVPRISQRPYTGDCAIASMATVEAYCYGLPSGDYNSTAYQAVYAANGYSVSAMWSQLGYETIEYFDKQIAYNQLKLGYPVVVHRGSSHYSVIYGYDGSSTSLELSGFLVCDVDDSYNSTTAYKRLDSWAGGYGLDRMVIRRNGLVITSNGLRITSNHPSAYHEKGTKFVPYGTVASSSTLTNVTVTVTTSTGNAVQTYNTNPKSTSYRLSSIGNINISSLAIGNYTYTITAKDSSGATKTFEFDFKVVSNAYIPADEDEKPVIKEVNYKAVVTADPSLNLRTSASVDSSSITSIPKGEVITVTAECNGWAMTTYKGHSGWVSLQYLDEYVEPVVDPIVDPVEPVDPIVLTVKYGRITSKAYLRSAKFIFSSTVAQVQANDIVRVISADGSWLKVSYSGKEGYIPASLVVVGLFDVDCSNSINSADALCVLEHAIGKKTLTDTPLAVADINGDGKVNSLDALEILRVATGEKTY